MVPLGISDGSIDGVRLGIYIGKRYGKIQVRRSGGSEGQEYLMCDGR